MYRQLIDILLKTMLIILFIIIVLLPLFCYKLGIVLEILPALEILLVFYLYCYANIRFDEIFILGILFDQLYNMPVGTNSAALITGIVFIKLVSKWFIIKEYLANFIILCGFSFTVILARWLIIYSNNISLASPTIFILYYLTTIFSYPILKILFDKIFHCLKKNYVR